MHFKCFFNFRERFQEYRGGQWPRGGVESARRLRYSRMSHDDDERKSLKRQKKEYRDEKKRVTQQLVSALADPTIVVMADWLKVRGTLRKWSKYYCVLKPGIMILYKTSKQGHWVGTVLLNTCELIERPSKKDGFCFKLYQPLDQSIWANCGPQGESTKFSLQHLPTTHLICRAASEQAGRCWMDALELSLRCTGLLMRTMHQLNDQKQGETSNIVAKDNESEGDVENAENNHDDRKYSETEAEKHFDGLDDQEHAEEDVESDGESGKESNWVESERESFGQSTNQTEEVADENKSLIWALLKQIRPGMDLSKVVLPTFILEPRSFLEKLADYYYHADLLTEAAEEPDPYQRIIKVTKFYLSGFYKKPKGLKKPYNPILGETFRCSWKHPDGSTTFYIAEQVSHHPPVSSLFLTNRKAGFNISGTILAKSKFYGNSISAIMVGSLRLTFLKRGETYNVTLPYANCKGIMLGTMTMELAGPVTITCENTGYSCHLDFQLKPFIGGVMNKIVGKYNYGREELAKLEGFWDGKIMLKERKSETLLWDPTPEVIRSRLPRSEIDFESQDGFESKKLWSYVTAAILEEDQYKATEEKTKLEEDQRARARSNIPHKNKYFEKHGDVYDYVYAEYRPWDEHDDIEQKEYNYHVYTKTRVRKNKKAQKRSQSGSGMSTSTEGDRPIDHSTGHKTKTGVKVEVEELKLVIKSLSDQIEKNTRRLECCVERTVQDNIPNIQQILLIVFLFAILHAALLAWLSQKGR